MKKLLLISAATLIVSNSTFAGGILTNTNQHAAFLVLCLILPDWLSYPKTDSM